MKLKVMQNWLVIIQMGAIVSSGSRRNDMEEQRKFSEL
jgi:hypothetical protein